jgi:spore germination protein YaaH
MAVQCVSFTTGIVVITPNALDRLTPADIQRGLQRHQAGDWGDLGEEDWKENDRAVQARMRLLSSYRSDGGVPFWIITEADRSATTLLLPDEY